MSSRPSLGELPVLASNEFSPTFYSDKRTKPEARSRASTETLASSSKSKPPTQAPSTPSTQPKLQSKGTKRPSKDKEKKKRKKDEIDDIFGF